MSSELKKQLIEIGYSSLQKMLIPDKNLFCHKVEIDDKTGQLKQVGISLRYTAMTLIGLAKAKKSGLLQEIPDSWINLKSVMTSLVGEMESIHNYGDLGLFLYASCVTDDQWTGKILDKIRNSGEFCTKEKIYYTMEHAWLLAGLSKYAEINGLDSTIKTLSERILRQILSVNYCSRSGLFYASNPIKRMNFITARRNNRVASFAEQIYPLWALSIYYQVTKEEKILEIANKLAKTITGLQGNNGEWWWIYYVPSGRVSEKYPVYSVHQEAMAPMGFYEYEKASGISYSVNIDKGIQWMARDSRLIDTKNGIIWRGIQRKNRTQKNYGFGMGFAGHLDTYISAWSGGVSLNSVFDTLGSFELVHESRPYHPGWLLNALLP